MAVSSAWKTEQINSVWRKKIVLAFRISTSKVDYLIIISSSRYCAIKICVFMNSICKKYNIDKPYTSEDTIPVGCKAQ